MVDQQRPEQLSSRTKLLRAAETLMREQGYAAVTSRQVAKKAGLKPQLVHYHFKSMDELFVALYREFANRLLDKQRRALEADNPLRVLWDLGAEAQGTLLTEFVALANHRKAIRSEIATLGRQYRRHQIATMEKILHEHGGSQLVSNPAVATLVLNCLSRGLAVENVFGINEGHDEALAMVEEFIARFDEHQ